MPVSKLSTPWLSATPPSINGNGHVKPVVVILCQLAPDLARVVPVEIVRERKRFRTRRETGDDDATISASRSRRGDLRRNPVRPLPMRTARGCSSGNENGSPAANRWREGDLAEGGVRGWRISRGGPVKNRRSYTSAWAAIRVGVGRLPRARSQPGSGPPCRSAAGWSRS